LNIKFPKSKVGPNEILNQLLPEKTHAKK
jgi:hypothetical protein